MTQIMKVEEAISVLTQLSEEDLSAWIKIDTPEGRVNLDAFTSSYYEI